jgi:hypothetical protein
MNHGPKVPPNSCQDQGGGFESKLDNVLPLALARDWDCSKLETIERGICTRVQRM